MKKSQSAVEFSLLLAFMLLALVVFVGIANTKMDEVTGKRNQKILNDLAGVVKSEMELATMSEPGYNRTFNLPSRMNQKEYTIYFKNGSSLGTDFSTITVYFNDEPETEVTIFTSPNITGKIFKGANYIQREGNLTRIDDN